MKNTCLCTVILIVISMVIPTIIFAQVIPEEIEFNPQTFEYDNPYAYEAIPFGEINPFILWWKYDEDDQIYPIKEFGEWEHMGRPGYDWNSTLYYSETANITIRAYDANEYHSEPIIIEARIGKTKEFDPYYYRRRAAAIKAEAEKEQDNE